jgi:hypothetical protein
MSDYLDTFIDRVRDMKSITATQCDDGNWNYNEYMFGMANGMELILSIAEGREPRFKDRPKEFLVDKDVDVDEKVLESGDSAC